MKTAVLFSGGKDSFFSLQKAKEKQGVDLILSIQAESGETQLHAGPESSEELRKAQLQSIDIPHVELQVHSGKDYLHDLFLKLQGVLQKEGITHLVTGDLWHPYTSGIGDMLAGALGAELIRPAREACTRLEDGMNYMHELLAMNITSLIVSVRKGNIDKSFVGREINENLLTELESLGVDVAAEGGEYQSLVIASPLMNLRLVIDDFIVDLIDGKNGKEQFYRMNVKEFHTEKA